MKRTDPLFIVCTRRGCGVVKEVSRPSEQRTRKYCSARCNALATQNIRRAIDSRTGIEESARRRRQQVLDRVRGLTPLEAFRLGYVRGLGSKSRQIRKRYVLIKRAEA